MKYKNQISWNETKKHHLLFAITKVYKSETKRLILIENVLVSLIKSIPLKYYFKFRILLQNEKENLY